MAPLATASSTCAVTVASWEGVVRLPTSRLKSYAAPVLSFFVRAVNAALNASRTDSAAYRRSMETRSRPAEGKRTATAPSAAFSPPPDLPASAHSVNGFSGACSSSTAPPGPVSASAWAMTLPVISSPVPPAAHRRYSVNS